MTRELELVELVDADGSPIGTSTVVDAHNAPGQLHRAFSVVLFDHSGRTLLQQRAAMKTRFPLCWANACCGHPAPGEEPVVAARRRLVEELGVRVVALTDVGTYSYTAADPETGRVEREYDHVLVGTVSADLRLTPDPEEVAATRWTAVAALIERLETGALGYAPWLAGVLRQAASPG